jgi:PQQ-dependent catabolism-associated CXXCW motif protein
MTVAPPTPIVASQWLLGSFSREARMTRMARCLAVMLLSSSAMAQQNGPMALGGVEQVYGSCRGEFFAALHQLETQQPMPPTSTWSQSPSTWFQPQPQPTLAANPGNESSDFGVRPQIKLHANVGSPTPTFIPGARVITTAQLLQTMQSGGVLLLVDVLYDTNNPPHPTLPGAARFSYAGQPGSFNDQIQQRLEMDLAKATQQRTQQRPDVPIVFFCAGSQCWESYNAALRAEYMGFQRVYWYRGGLAAWQAANLPMMPSSAGGMQQGMPQGGGYLPPAPRNVAR